MRATSGQFSSALLVVTQRIGDVLLASPIIASLKRTWPNVAVDVLVFAGTEGVLEGNANIREIIVTSRLSGVGQSLSMMRRLWRRYDLALTPLCGDRPVLYTWAAARHRVGPVQVGGRGQFWKRLALSRHVTFDDRDTHTVRMGLQIAQLSGATPVAHVQASWSEEHARTASRVWEQTLKGRAFAVLHPTPKYNYKRWHAEGWRQLTLWLLSNGLQVVLTGGHDEQEHTHAYEIFPDLPTGVHNLIGQHSLGEISALLTRATLYVGPDTATTHLAAALGIPTVALFGPSNPVKWGPWPKDHDASTNPYVVRGTQHVGNVVLLQGEGDCVPCFLEGCDRHNDSFSDCLQTMSAQTVQSAIETLLA